MKFYEVQDYMLLSGHAYLAQMFLVSGAWFDALSAEDQELVTKIAKEVAVWVSLAREAQNSFDITEFRRAIFKLWRHDCTCDIKAFIGHKANSQYLG